MKIAEMVKELVKYSGAPDAFDYILGYMYKIGMPPPPDDFVKSLITVENPNPDFHDIRSKWIVRWVDLQFMPKNPHAIFSGPCAHERTPWYSCDACGKGNVLQAAVARLKDRENHLQELERANKLVAKDLNARRWIREAYRLDKVQHLPGCKFNQDGSCSCLLEELLK